MIYLGFFALSILVFLPSWKGPMRLHDDQTAILNRRDDFERLPLFHFVRNLGQWGDSRYVFDFVNHVQFKLFRFWSPAWHCLNYLLHGLTACLLYMVLNRRLGWAYSEWLTLAWMVHPFQCSSVCYVTGRSGLLAGFFMFSGVLVYLNPFPWCLASAILFSLAYLSREDSIVVLAWLPFLEWYRG